MYGDKFSVNVNKCRFTLFKLGKCSDEMLPPTCDSLLLHIRRANYQAAIWRRCLESQLVMPIPHGNGWKLVNGELEIVWRNIPAAPDSLLECVSCGCKTGCSTQRSCKKANLHFTDVCACEKCSNVNDGVEDAENDIEDIGSDTDEEI